MAKRTMISLGGDLRVGRIGYGAMRLTGPDLWGDYPDRDGGITLLRQAVEAGVTLIEWPERLEPLVPAPRLDVRIDGAGTDRRSISIEAVGSGPERYLRAVAP